MRKLFIIILAFFMTSCKDESKQPLHYMDADTSSNKVVQLTDEDDYYYTLENLIDQNKGKITYVHFWNTYSGDIVKRLEDIDQLKSDVNSDDFEVIHISTDRNNSYWKSFAAQVDLEHNYIARNYPQGKFYEENKFFDIPRFMIYTADGTLLDNNAMGPENPQLSDVIKQLLP
ncbi:TlpA family protein disulfide reductase [Nonlabens ponticola]|uniref:Thioredoxin domain-containing protein n=1 Tax=Nonlabens ponticola TaxID=2496866 RepID=A0A3S9MVT4_9FLAO|nr:thioredoxin-like domain-containing protein [Nonlabens ponticola]AZQ43244.1 hypothetical protein EJ995_02960 [Nonlabens ponticola]